VCFQTKRKKSDEDAFPNYGAFLATFWCENSETALRRQSEGLPDSRLKIGWLNGFSGMDTTRAEDAQGTPTQCHISPSIIQVDEDKPRSWCRTQKTLAISLLLESPRDLHYILEGYHHSRRCSRYTYPESYITKHTSIRRHTWGLA